MQCVNSISSNIIITDKQKAIQAIATFCQEKTSRRREDLFNYLDLTLDIYIDRSLFEHDSLENDTNLFSCQSKEDAKVLLERAINALKNKIKS